MGMFLEYGETNGPEDGLAPTSLSLVSGITPPDNIRHQIAGIGESLPSIAIQDFKPARSKRIASQPQIIGQIGRVRHTRCGRMAGALEIIDVFTN